MANFKTHISWGVILGIILATSCVVYSLTSGVEFVFWIFIATLIGSFLPDLDVDDGIPFKMVFGILAATLASLVFFYFFQEGSRQLRYLLLIPILIFILVRFIAGYIFMQLTHHRGIFHSIPAAFVFGLLTLWIFKKVGIEDKDNFLISLAVFSGYLIHLLLDEFYASITFDGLKFRSKKSLGTALKVYSTSHVSTFLVYFILGTLIVALYNLGMLTALKQYLSL